MDAKAKYSNRYLSMKEEALKNPNSDAAKFLKKGKGRTEEYGDGWESANINEVVDRIAPNSEPFPKGPKFVYNNEDETMAVVSDPGGGYFRVQDLTKKTGKPRYLDQFGNGVEFRTTEKGKKQGRPKDEILRLTHYRIKKREEM
ncbi:MAG: hypothetical protein IJM30_01710 [Thermoguttaceae bacterium]|nr:hypothetical protein [Thermoguttaceae bacterium]